MKLVGLTGSIGMGKSTTGRLFAEEGVPVYDADAAVHAVYDAGGAAVKPVGEAFPGVVRNGRVDRAALSAAVLGKPEQLKRLEAIVHPLLGKTRVDFLAKAHAQGADIAVLDIPLLFETGGDKNFETIVVVSAPEAIQRARVLERPGMTAEKLDAILARQTPDAEKRARATHVIETGAGIDAARGQVRALIAGWRAGKA